MLQEGERPPSPIMPLLPSAPAPLPRFSQLIWEVLPATVPVCPFAGCFYKEKGTPIFLTFPFQLCAVIRHPVNTLSLPIYKVEGRVARSALPKTGSAELQFCVERPHGRYRATLARPQGDTPLFLQGLSGPPVGSRAVRLSGRRAS